MQVFRKLVLNLQDGHRDFATGRSDRGNDVVLLMAEQGSASNERTIDVQINRLRRKIEEDPGNPIHLQTVRGVGYRLVVER